MVDGSIHGSGTFANRRKNKRSITAHPSFRETTEKQNQNEFLEIIKTFCKSFHDNTLCVSKPSHFISQMDEHIAEAKWLCPLTQVFFNYSNWLGSDH